MSTTAPSPVDATWQGYMPEPPPLWEDRPVTRTAFYLEFIEVE